MHSFARAVLIDWKQDRKLAASYSRSGRLTFSQAWTWLNTLTEEIPVSVRGYKFQAANEYGLCFSCKRLFTHSCFTQCCPVCVTEFQQIRGEQLRAYLQAFGDFLMYFYTLHPVDQINVMRIVQEHVEARK